jgi:hypothetical protein
MMIQTPETTFLFDNIASLSEPHLKRKIYSLKYPAIVGQVADDPDYPFEFIIGNPKVYIAV